MKEAGRNKEAKEVGRSEEVGNTCPRGEAAGRRGLTRETTRLYKAVLEPLQPGTNCLTHRSAHETIRIHQRSTNAVPTRSLR